MGPFENVEIPLPEIEQADHADDVDTLHRDDAEHARSLRRVVFCLFGREAYDDFERVLRDLEPS